MCNCRASICPTAANPPNAAAAGLLLCARRAGDIDQLLHGRRSAANASSVTLSAAVGSWTETSLGSKIAAHCDLIIAPLSVVLTPRPDIPPPQTPAPDKNDRGHLAWGYLRIKVRWGRASEHPVEESVRMTEDRDKWRKYVHMVCPTVGLRTARQRTEQGRANVPMVNSWGQMCQMFYISLRRRTTYADI